ncbi:MAG: FtsX-like permease family protein [Nitrospira sp. SB0662_bin_26]|nr:FtsX-like permease family protein [Nitrospira sp. SB0662_bin_26]
MQRVPISCLMAWREIRGSWRQFVFFLACLAVGVGAVVGIDLFATNVESLILRDARSLLGGDLEIRAAHQLSESGRETLDDLRARHITVTYVRELVGMAAVPVAEHSRQPGTQSTQLVELKAVEEQYPLYGQVEVSPHQSLHDALAPFDCPSRPCFGAVMQESLLISFGLQLHDHVKIGQAWFAVTGTLVKEPDRVASAFSLGPRVLISRQALQATDLVKPGSRVRERYLLRVPESLALGPLRGELQGRLGPEGAGVSSYRDAQPRIRRFLDQLTIYLGLIGLTSLFVGGIGIACTIHGFMRHRLTTVAILKTLGADAGLLIRVYLLQSLFMGLLGSMGGVAMGVGLQRLLPVLLGELIPVAVSSQVTVLPLSKGLLVGVVTTFCFTIWPLLAIREIPPALVFRREVEQHHVPVAGSRFRWMWNALVEIVRDRHRLGTAVIMGFGLTVLAMWQARSLTLGALFIVAFCAAVILLQVGVWVLLRGLGKLPRPRSFVIRQALGNVQRPGNFTRGMAVAIGVGVMVIVTVALVKSSLLVALGERIPEDAPTFFFIDIQPDQREAFEAIVPREAPQAPYRLTPVVRARLRAIDGHVIDPEEYKGKKNGWYFTREYVLTALSALPRDNVVVKGAWWPADSPDVKQTDARQQEASIRVSVEDQAAVNLGVDVGSTIEFVVQGATLPALVQSTRKVDWGSFSMNFFMILSPGALDGAPMTYIASAKVEPDEELPLQHALVRTLPNVTAIKVGDVLANVARLLEQLAWAIQGMALLSMVSGAVVMTAAVSSTRYRRLYESAILKAIGGTRGIVVESFAVEFALIGGLAGLIGVGLASALSWAILHFFLDLSWTFQPLVLGWGLMATVGLAVAVGFLSTFKILGEPPLAVLRQE